MAATPNDEANALVCAAFAAEVGKGRVTQVPSAARALERGERHAATPYPFAFGDRLTLDVIENVLAGGGHLVRARAESAVSAVELGRTLGVGLRPLAEVAPGGRATLVRARDAVLGPRTTVIALGATPGLADSSPG